MARTSRLVAGAALLALVVIWALRGSAFGPGSPLEPAVAVVPGGAEQVPREVLTPDQNGAGALAELREAGTSERSTLAPPAPAAGGRFAALDVAVRWERSGAPAPETDLRLIVWGAPANERLRRGRTGADGRARFEDLWPGRTVVVGGRGGQGSIELAAGEKAELELAIPRGFDVRGHVIDADGAPVGGARLWLSEHFNHSEGHLVASSRADGSFELRDVPPARYLAAIARGHAPSHAHLLRDLQDEEGQDVELTLELNGPGGLLRLRILDPDGAPVEGAHVRADGASPPMRTLASHRTLLSIPPREGFSDAAGEVELDGLPQAFALVRVLAAGFAPKLERMAVERTAGGVRILTLVAEGTVSGSVFLPGGAPAAGASVHSAEGTYSPLRPSTTTRADGTFELRGLPVGRVVLMASLRAHGSATTTVELAPGGEARWDAVLDAGRSVTGTVRDAAGQPLEGWSVVALVGHHSPWRAQGRTDQDGAFRMVDCQPGTLMLELRRPGEPAALPVLSELLAGDQHEIHFRVGPDDLPECWITGRLAAPGGAPARGLISTWVPGASSGAGFRTEADGGFRVGPLPPGPYPLSADPEGLPRLLIATVELRPRETLDLGTLRLEALARVHVTVGGVGPAKQGAYHGFSLASLWETSDGRRATWPLVHVEAPGAEEGIELHAGRYLLRASARDGFADEELELTVEAGEELAIDLRPRPGRFCYLGVSVPPEDELPGRVRLRILDVAGRELLDFETPFANDRRYIVGASLAAGSYRLEASAHDGRCASAPFELAAEEGTPPFELVLPLRRP